MFVWTENQHKSTMAQIIKFQSWKIENNNLPRSAPDLVLPDWETEGDKYISIDI